MPLAYRIVLGCLALVSAGFTVRALQTGIVYGRGFTPWHRDKDFGQYASHMLGGIIFIVFCAFGAAGYSPHDILAPLGLGALFK